jgi:methionyl-tRNA formyltransferase
MQKIVTPFEKQASFRFRCSPSSFVLFRDSVLGAQVKPVVIKEEWPAIAKLYDLVFSLHCKQIFPGSLVRAVKCINIHPGLNPFNRGWYPQVFAIVNGKPHGATIHEMDEQVDHGPIIDQATTEIRDEDTSRDVYDRVLGLELDLLRRNLPAMLAGTCVARPMQGEGNYNSIQDFRDLCHIDLDRQMTLRDAIRLLRALTHEPYWNAYFVSPDGSKVYIKIRLEKETRGHA